MNNNKNDYLYSGGFAEIVSKPSPQTAFYLKNWFTGVGSVGEAMRLLGLPYEKVNLAILEKIENDLYENLKNEEATLYKKTIFKYQKQSQVNYIPRLKISLLKLINPLNIFNSLKILLIQSNWIAFPQKYVFFTKELISQIPSPESKHQTTEELSDVIKYKVFPKVIAIGLLSEFYFQLLKKETKDKYFETQNIIDSHISLKDWFFLSLRDQLKVKEKKLSFEEYLRLYGIRGDKDYELTCPRWFEMPNIIRERIKEQKAYPQKNIIDYQNNKNKVLIETVINLELLRSEAKKKTLYFINELRKATIITNQETEADFRVKPVVKTKSNTVSGKGMPVSVGVAKGLTQIIYSSSDKVRKNCIAVFPNASPEFSIQYPKCKGIIFLKGGQTSHGSIVAREYGIPALIDGEAEALEDNTLVSLNGQTGEWSK